MRWVKFILSQVSFISKSNSENCINICWFLTKSQTKISWLLFYSPWCTCILSVETYKWRSISTQFTKTNHTRAKDVLPNINRTQGPWMSRSKVKVTAACSRRDRSVAAGMMGVPKSVFCPWWPWPLTLTFKLVRSRDQTRPRCEFDANPFSSSEIFDAYAQIRKWMKKVTDSAKNRTLLVCSNKLQTAR